MHIAHSNRQFEIIATVAVGVVFPCVCVRETNLSVVTMTQVNAPVLLFIDSMAPRTLPNFFRSYCVFIELDKGTIYLYSSPFKECYAITYKTN